MDQLEKLTRKNEQTLQKLYISWVITMIFFLGFLYLLSIGHEYRGRTIMELISK